MAWPVLFTIDRCRTALFDFVHWLCTLAEADPRHRFAACPQSWTIVGSFWYAMAERPHRAKPATESSELNPDIAHLCRPRRTPHSFTQCDRARAARNQAQGRHSTDIPSQRGRGYNADGRCHISTVDRVRNDVSEAIHGSRLRGFIWPDVSHID